MPNAQELITNALNSAYTCGKYDDQTSYEKLEANGAALRNHVEALQKEDKDTLRVSLVTRASRKHIKDIPVSCLPAIAAGSEIWVAPEDLPKNIKDYYEYLEHKICHGIWFTVSKIRISEDKQKRPLIRVLVNEYEYKIT